MSPPKLRVTWTIPAPVILAIVGQAVVLAYFGATWKAGMEGTMSLLDNRVSVVERTIANNSALIERVTRVEEQVGGLKEQGTRIENKLDNALERRAK